MVTIIGVDHVGIGTDTKLTPSYRPPGAQNGSGGGQNRGRIDERTNEAWQDQTVRFFYAVVDSLLQVGFFEDEIGTEGVTTSAAYLMKLQRVTTENGLEAWVK